MSEETTNTNQNETVNSTAQDQHVPLSRLNQEIAKRKDLEAKIKAAEDARLKETENYKALYEKSLAEKAELQAKIFDGIKQNIAIEYGLPGELRKRLHGETEEELRTDAQFLASLLKPAEKPKPQAPDINASSKSNTKSIANMSQEEFANNRAAMLEQLKNSYFNK